MPNLIIETTLQMPFYRRRSENIRTISGLCPIALALLINVFFQLKAHPQKILWICHQ